MDKPENKTNCPLCDTTAAPFCEDRLRPYLRCPHCDLIFVPQEHHLSSKNEKARYDLHQNDPSDTGYRSFLSRLFTPVKEKLSPGAQGLDFGSGPGPALSLMFQEAGFDCDIYDLYYANNRTVLSRQYDFITCSETIEHMYQPRAEFERLVSMTRPGGWIGIMTQLHDEAPTPFNHWHYKDDDTHVCFFSKESFRTLAKNYPVRIEFYPKGVVLFQIL
jgi:hypothetical protein